MIFRKFKTRMNWIKPTIALTLMCVMFGFSAMAQDKPLNAQQLTNLISGLKDALRENLAVSETDGKKYSAIIQKWNARADLTGKSKRQVIDLLFQDVKSVVTDSGKQYQISQVFTLYKRMPDSQSSSETSFTDSRDGQIYGIKKLGNLTWMKENLRFNFSNASWCYDDDDNNCAELGRLYTFQAALKACPVGWRLPSDNDWLDLEKALGLPQNQWLIDGYNSARGGSVGQKLKSGGSSRLEFKISGYAFINNGNPEFDGIDDDRPRSYFWTATSHTVNNQTIAVRRRIEAKNGNVFRFGNPTNGYAVAVRCVQ
jgi:uncharacterized protein (TIGR02145 family)